MNTSNIKKYAPKARNDFIAAITKQAAKYGITDKAIEPVIEKGDLALIGDRPFPASVIKPRAALAKKIELQGFQQVVEQVAYSWFNRLCAIRFMELKGYLDHGRRVLSAADGSAGMPQILEDCLDIELPGMDQNKVRELKLDGTKDEELYRELLLTQCHALYQAMPFLFEAVDDETELLLPENLTKTDSLIRELVDAMPEEDWEEVEVIGWLYQFYISEKKDQVIGKVVKSEDIPAATQLFTPNWIVKYLVQNSVGRQWLQTYPESPLKSQMEYYIEPAEQTAEVQEQLKAITPDHIDPEAIKVLDPACGSGHILVEAYKVLKAIYEERGYRSRDIPQLILEKNLYGLDIDDRAAQLAGFALLMLAREDDRRIFGRELKLNFLAIQESKHIDLESNWRDAELPEDATYKMVQDVWHRFEQGKIFGSLINIPASYESGLKALLDDLYGIASQGGMLQKPAAQELLTIVQQTWVLSQRYDAVVANPPYMGSKGMNTELKAFAKKVYPNSKSDLFAIFMERSFSLLKEAGRSAQVNLQSWMFLTGFDGFREKLIKSHRIENLMHIGYNSFPELNSKIVQCSASIINNNSLMGFLGKYINLNSAPQSADKKKVFIGRSSDQTFKVDQRLFKEIPGSPIAYWVTDTFRDIFKSGQCIEDISPVRQGFQTGDNDRFLRYWHELDVSKICFDAEVKEDVWEKGKKWVPYNKGGDFRRWYGNNEYLVSFDERNYEVLSKMGNCLPSRQLYFKKSITWSSLTSSEFGARLSQEGFTFSAKGACSFPRSEDDFSIICSLLNSRVAQSCLDILAPTLDFNVGDIRKIPLKLSNNSRNLIRDLFETALYISKSDWDSQEVSWDFKRPSLLEFVKNKHDEMYLLYKSECSENVETLKSVEENINEIFSKEYGLSEELESSVDLNNITLLCNPNYKYGKHNEEDVRESRFRSDSYSDLIAYSIGCMMGRYSLDSEGLVYAHSGNERFAGLVETGAYRTFPVDEDGIIPLTDQEWFSDDATNRFRDFMKITRGEEYLQSNLDFVAESLCLSAIKIKKSEPALDTIRRYLSTQFYKDHLKTYKKRPIYWLFSSGKQKAFECLVYLHRYNEGTLARMRTEYVIPLTSKLAAHVEKLEKDVEASTSAAEIKRLEKEISQLHKQQAELAEFDEKLRHYADRRIKLDLDDGVKVNYGKFGDLLAEVKAVTGKKPEVV